ncbi:hydroxypyruvate isomerase family protein [Dactylosporangium sp. CA-092794]|uniref:hydroxypyruvate isomerase family protein n=1 Tax=Dactylosporangium sp. CA-092794 TaxID=3239929 RepID=UPI003D92324D
MSAAGVPIAPSAFTFPSDANISMLFTHLPLNDRPAAAAEAGFDAVEVWWPFPTPTPSAREIGRFEAALRAAGTRLVSINLHEGDPHRGDRGRISWPHATDAVRANAEIVLDIAEATECRLVNALYGNRLPELDPTVQRDVALDNIAHLAQRAGPRGITVVLETLNRFDSPAFPLIRLENTIRLLHEARERAGLDNIALLFDVYHLHRSGSDLVEQIRLAADRIAHVQLADDPGRGRPGSGAIDFPAVLEALHDVGYRGYLGLEYIPEPDSPGGRPLLNDLLRKETA